MKSFEEIQKYLPIGYLLLIVIGLLKVSIFYYQLGVNILNYYSLTDILINPLADMTSEPAILIAFGIFTVLAIIMVRSRNKKWMKQFFFPKNRSVNMTEEQYRSAFRQNMIAFASMGIIFFFAGLGYGRGKAISKRIAAQTLNYNEAISLIGMQDEKVVYLIEANSVNYFYVEKGSITVTISPKEAVRSIRTIKPR